MTEITAIVNVHREGMLAVSSLRSAKIAQLNAQTAGLAVEVLVVADCSDAATLDVVAQFEGVRVFQTTVDDLGQARNAGVLQAQGRFIAFLDGDDLWGPNWLLLAYRASEQTRLPTVWHPEASLFFAGKRKPYWLFHPDMDTMDGDWVALGLRNHWTSLSFALAETYRRIPYPRSDFSSGLGYEDWSWNSEVIAQGFVHKLVPDTVHLVRMNENSMVMRTSAMRALVTPSSLFRRRVGWESRVCFPRSLGRSHTSVARDNP
jgi:glycosyltransferase involved in cell wall biosynthesis